MQNDDEFLRAARRRFARRESKAERSKPKRGDGIDVEDGDITKVHDESIPKRSAK